MKKLLKNNLNIFILIIAGIIIHIQWFKLNDIFSFGDWGYWPVAITNKLYNSYGTWISFLNFGSVNIQIYFNIFTSIWSMFTNLGFSYDLATKVTFLIPVAILGFITPYVLFKKLINHSFIAFIVALFYGTTTHFIIRQTGHLPIAFVYSITPLILFSFINALKINDLKYWIFFILLSFIGICYEVRIMYIVYFILFFYFCFFHLKDIGKYVTQIIFSLVILILLNLFWLLPTLFGGLITQIEQVANRGLFGTWLFTLNHAFTLFESSWTGKYPNTQFVKQLIINYFWLIPMMAFSVFSLNKNVKFKKQIIFFGIISLIGIFLTKQAVEPIAGAYLWLYNNFPGFNLFREASKFYLLTSIGYTGLLGYSLLTLKEQRNIILSKYVFSSFVIIIISIAIINIKPLITGEIGTMFVPREIPNDYLIFNDFILKQNSYFRTFWTPNYSKWGSFTNQKSKISNVNIISNEWKDYFFSKTGYDRSPINGQIIEVYKTKVANELFDISSIKYAVVPLQDKANNDDFFIYYGNNRKFYIDQINKIKWLKKIDIGTKELVIYENKDFRPHIYQTLQKETIAKNIPYSDVNNASINPTEYKIKLKNISIPIFINFSESFHRDWKIRIGKFNWFKVLTEKNYFIPDKSHFKNDAQLNSFSIDPISICKSFECKKNQDGTYDIDLTLYFRPQSYFYLGLIISGITLFGCLTYLIFALIGERGSKNKLI